jgi:hypothetical protein
LTRNSAAIRKSIHIDWPAIVSQKQYKIINQIMPWGQAADYPNSHGSLDRACVMHSQP